MLDRRSRRADDGYWPLYCRWGDRTLGVDADRSRSRWQAKLQRITHGRSDGYFWRNRADSRIDHLLQGRLRLFPAHPLHANGKRHGCRTVVQGRQAFGAPELPIDEQFHAKLTLATDI